MKLTYRGQNYLTEQQTTPQLSITRTYRGVEYGTSLGLPSRAGLHNLDGEATNK